MTLFVENTTLDNDNSMSTCYNIKCSMIKNDPRFHFYNITSKEKIDIASYQTVIFGCRSLYLYKRYIGQIKKSIMEKNKMLCQISHKYFIIQDMHHKTYGNIDVLCSFIRNNNINIIFTFYNNAEAKAIRNRTPNVKHLYLPHHIDTSIFHFTNEPKQYDILLFGSVHPKHYPFRKRLFELILKNKDKFNIRYIEHPSKFDPNVCEGGLAKLINMSKICIATKSRYDYLVGKYFEIAMCKSLIAGDIPTDGMSMFKGKIVELYEKMSDTEIIENLGNAIQNYDLYVGKIDELHQLVNFNYGLGGYVEKLKEMVTLV